ncbi:MAG: hypothetical protein KGL57_10785 [Burkholderiales bacterium]|nr:hypothetical protein [Burkholderiales bacterium]
MKSMVQTKRLLTVLVAASVLSLTACGGGGGGSGAAATTSSTGGDGTPVAPAAVVAVQGQKLAAGVGYSLGVTSAGKVQPWGSGMHGALSTTSTVAAVGTASWGTNLNASWAVTSSGDLLYWGDDAAGKLTANAVVLSGLGHVAAARACGAGNGAMLYVLKTDGSVWGVPARDLTDSTKGFAVTGVGQAKALGDGADATCSSMLAIDKDGGVWQLQARNPADVAGGVAGVPTQAQGLAKSGLSKVAQASCAASSCLAVDSTGQVWAWGKNDLGQLGDGTRVDAPTPFVIDVFGAKISNVLMTQDGTAYALAASGTLYGWSLQDGPAKVNSFRDAGITPRSVIPKEAMVQSLAASPVVNGHALILLGSNDVQGWGQNGSAEVVDKSPSPPLLVQKDTGINLQ